VFPPWCLHHAAKTQTGSPRLAFPTARTDPEVYDHPEACLTSYAAPSGFGYPLGVLFLPDPLDRFSGPSAPGVCPFRVLLPSGEPCPFRGLVALLSLICDRIRRSDRKPRLQSFALSGRAVLAAGAVNADMRRSSLGVSISEAFSLASLLPLRVNSSFVLRNHPRCETAGACCTLEFF
jgi:hypothetical protein